jgi:formylglycine-generating enzyme required for sulfatase activity
MMSPRHRLAAVLFLLAVTTPGCQQSAAPGANRAGAKVGPAAEAASPPALTSRSGVEQVVIPGGSFEMGSRRGRAEEKPPHKVWVGSFVMDRHEVTQREYEAIGKIEAFPNPSHFSGADLPVEQVTWPQAARFCNARARLEGLAPCYNEETGACDFGASGYRLPTEAEWEYACRAGTSGDYSFGSDERQLSHFGWFTGNSSAKTHLVGQKRPNPWGLFDMHGNVAEWCQDVYDPAYYKTSPEKDPCGAGEGDQYVLRGGSWKSTADALRSAYRLGETAGFSDACLARDAIGFRCVRKN